jgi:Secretion system C-terminal sorting domain
MRLLILVITVFFTFTVRSQTYPSFGQEIDVIINGLSFDAMEPFISPDGNFLFFNNLNDGVDTKLYYATKINDSTFNFAGELNGTNQIILPHLDAVADMDSANNFYWTSTRNYPTELDNLFHGTINMGNVTNIGRVHGDFNKNIPGWLVMDHGISYNGQFLYYNNARFDNNNCQGPCETEIGIAQKINDSTFNKLSNSNIILQNINDTNYIYYAPCISRDNLELYYTRYPRDTITVSTLFEICVAVRKRPADIFSVPMVLFSEFISDLIEAPTLTTDKQIIYYHRKIVSSHKIVMRYRENPLGILTSTESELSFFIYPNPTKGILNIKTELSYQNLKISIFTLLGERVITTTNQTEIDINSLSTGTYFLRINIDGKTGMKKIIKIE